MISRRRFITGFVTGLTPLAATASAQEYKAQQATSRWRVGVLLVLLSPTGKEAQAFRQGLRNAGYVEGRDLVIEWRSAEGDYTRLPQLAAELVDHRVDVIVADTTQAVQAALIRDGVHGLVVLGTVGENNSLSADEKRSWTNTCL